MGESMLYLVIAFGHEDYFGIEFVILVLELGQLHLGLVVGRLEVEALFLVDLHLLFVGLELLA